jgi:hypothetical protein
MRSNQFMGLITFILGGTMLLISGCATGPIAMNDAQRAEIRSAKTVNVIYHGLLGPVVQTAKNAVTFHFSMGLAGWDSIGAKIMKENGIEDPMLTARNRLVDRLKVEGGMKNLVASRETVPIDLENVEKLRQRYGKGLYLQIIPGRWIIIYYASNWSKYHMIYGATARLVRADDGKILWNAVCGLDRDDGDNAPTMDQLLANRAALLKTWTRESAQKCADTLTNAFLGKAV